MTPKWKTFLIINYVMIFPIALLTLNFLPDYATEHSNRDTFFSWILFAQLAGVLYNIFFNIFVVNRFFPDKLLTVKAKYLLTVSFILDILFIFTCFGVAIEGIGSMYYDEGKIDGYAVLLLLGIALLIIVTVYFIIMRIRMNKFLKQNHTITNIIDHKGE